MGPRMVNPAHGHLFTLLLTLYDLTGHKNPAPGGLWLSGLAHSCLFYSTIP